MDWKLGGLIVSLALLSSGCSDPKLEAEIQRLKDENAKLRGELDHVAKKQLEMSAQMDSLAAGIDAANLQVADALPVAEVGAPWTLWEKETLLNSRVLTGYKPDKPVDAYPTRSMCLQTATRHVQTHEGADSTQLSYVVKGEMFDTRFNYTCLPSGVDPRVR